MRVSIALHFAGMLSYIIEGGIGVCKKQLPITIPPIIGYVVHAYPLVLISKEERCLPWFFSNYIQFICNTGTDGVFLDFLSNFNILSGNRWTESAYPGIPWINCTSIDGKMLDACGLDISRLIKAAIDQDKYLIMNTDEYYIPNRRAYKQFHFYHENLIYGYDLNDMTYDVLGFDSRGTFGTSKISFKIIEQAYLSYYSHFPEVLTRMLKINEDFEYQLNLELIRDSLSDYITSKNSFGIHRSLYNPMSECVYGIKAYDELIKYLKQLAQGKDRYDIRAIHILYEHKKSMLLRLEYLLELYPEAGLENYCEKYRLIEQKCRMARQLLIKLSVIQKFEGVSNIIAALNLICEMEKEVIPEIIEKIDHIRTISA